MPLPLTPVPCPLITASLCLRALVVRKPLPFASVPCSLITASFGSGRMSGPMSRHRRTAKLLSAFGSRKCECARSRRGRSPGRSACQTAQTWPEKSARPNKPCSSGSRLPGILPQAARTQKTGTGTPLPVPFSAGPPRVALSDARSFQASSLSTQPARFEPPSSETLTAEIAEDAERNMSRSLRSLRPPR